MIEKLKELCGELKLASNKDSNRKSYDSDFSLPLHRKTLLSERQN